MPQRMWKLRCGCSPGVVSMGSRTCSTCGREGAYDGWHYTRLERVAIYQYRHHVCPTGPHRQLADELFDPFIRACEKCDGRGLLTDAATDVWEPCALCEGTGSVLTCDSSILGGILQRIAMSYPGSVVLNMPHPLKWESPIHDLAKG